MSSTMKCIFMYLPLFQWIGDLKFQIQCSASSLASWIDVQIVPIQELQTREVSWTKHSFWSAGQDAKHSMWRRLPNISSLIHTKIMTAGFII